MKAEEMVFLERARMYATAAHAAVGQKRKYSGKPYIVHPQAVMGILSKNGFHHDTELLAAAYLHDVVEDTAVTIDDIFREFGCDVGNLVAEVTDVSKPEDGNRATRKALDREHLTKASARGQTLKYADMLHNGKDIMANDPDFAIVYMNEMRVLLGMLTKGDEKLRDYVKYMVDEFFHIYNTREEPFVMAIRIDGVEEEVA